MYYGIYMLKRFIFACLFFCLLSSASANLYIFLPSEANIEKDGRFSLKYVQPGETVKFVFDRKSDSQIWDSISVSTSWPYSSQVLDKTINLYLTVPASETTALQNIKITLKDNRTGVEESYNLTIYIRDDLVRAGITNSYGDCNVGSIAEFELSLVNDSWAEHKLRIESSLPETWFGARSILLGPKETKIIKLPVNAFTPGYKKFSFYVRSELFERQFAELPASMKIYPSLKSKYTTAFYSMPFFSLSLLPSYLLNAFLSFLLT